MPNITPALIGALGKQSDCALARRFGMAVSSVRDVRVQVTSPDATTSYGSEDISVSLSPDALVEISVTLELAADIPTLTPALVFIEPRYDNRITFGHLTVPVVLNRPDSVSMVYFSSG